MSDDEIEQIAVRVARRYETSRGATVRSVEDEHVGFDLLSTRGLERRCIEVKGRAGVARVELTWSEFAKSQELGDDYWLYVVLDCAQPEPRLYRVQQSRQEHWRAHGSPRWTSASASPLNPSSKPPEEHPRDRAAASSKKNSRSRRSMPSRPARSRCATATSPPCTCGGRAARSP